MPIVLGEPARPRRATRWTLIALPLTVLLSLCLLLVVPRSSHVVDELSIPHEQCTIPDLQYTDDAGVQAAFSTPQHGAISHPYNQLGRPDRRPPGSPDLALAQIRPKRVAIVGAGASGSAAAFFLRRAARIMEERIGVPEGQLLGDVVVVDKEAYVGGRSTTVYPYGNASLAPVELGASIFVDANTNLVKAARLFNLTASPPDFGTSGVGIFNGTHFVYTTSLSSGLFSSWWDAISAVFRYGPLSPYRTNSAVSALLKKFALLYNPKFLSEAGAAEGVDEMVERVGLGKEMTAKRADRWAMEDIGVGDRWMGEIMEGSTRTNYARDMSEIHALGAAVSMATNGAKSIIGGNWQIFSHMLRNASATVVLNTEVTDILPFTSDTGLPQFQVRTNTSLYTDEPFDSVVFAAPWHLSPVNRKNMEYYFAAPIPEQKYVHLHVTLLVTTKERPEAGFFGGGVKVGTVLPNTILTSAFDYREGRNSTADIEDDAAKGGSAGPVVASDAAKDGRPTFQSISWHGETYPKSGEHVVKIFSLSPLSDQFLRDLIDEDPLWVLRKEWDSYPALKPMRDTGRRGEGGYAPVEPYKGFHYLAALEPWVSTMETQTLSAREAVARIVAEWWGMGYGECRGGADAWDWTCAGT